MPKEWLSDYSLEIANAHDITTGTVKKLVPNLMKKKKKLHDPFQKLATMFIVRNEIKENTQSIKIQTKRLDEPLY